MSIWYTTREAVRAAVELPHTAAMNKQIDRVIEDVSDEIRLNCRRSFEPWVGTRYFDRDPLTPSMRFYLDVLDLIELTSMTSSGVAVDLADLIFYPLEGPPYQRVELDESQQDSFEISGYDQKTYALTGTFGYTNAERLAALTSEALDDSEVDIDVSDGSQLGVGSLLHIDDEYLTVTNRSSKDLGVTLAQDLTSRANDTAAVLSATTAAVQSGEILLIGAERMEVLDVAGTTCVVERAVDGTVASAHSTGAAVYSPRTLRVLRGQQGTTAATHLQGAEVNVWIPPSPIEGLALAEAIVQQTRESSKYVRTVGSGESETEASGGDLRDKRKRVYNSPLKRHVTFGAL